MTNLTAQSIGVEIIIIICENTMIDPILSYQSLEKSVNCPVNRSLRIGSLVFSRFVLTRTITKIELIKKVTKRTSRVFWNCFAKVR